jgi:molecular chaperone IbpA
MEDMAMTTALDFSPLFRSSIGFDRLIETLENVDRDEQLEGPPYYDIVKEGDDAYEVTLAVPGFPADKLTVTAEPNLLMVQGDLGESEGADYLHRGMPRSFERRFELEDHLEVVGASFQHGLLKIRLKQELPEEMKPRRIPVQTPAMALSNKQSSLEGGLS